MENIDQQLKSSEDQMEMTMMMMMMQMDKLPELYNDVVADLPPSDHFSGASSTANFTDNSHMAASSSSFPAQISSNLSFTNTSCPLPQDRNVNPPPFLFNSGSGIRSTNPYGTPSEKRNSSMAAMREMIFRIAAMQPIHIDPESVKPPKRRNVNISKDPQSVVARHRRERISERIRILQKLVPGGTKMDTASMLDEAIHYVKFLKTQVESLERAAASRPPAIFTGIRFPVAMSSGSSSANCLPFPIAKSYQSAPPFPNVHHFGDS